MTESFETDEMDAIDRALEHYKNGIYQVLSTCDDPQEEADAELAAVNRAHKKVKKQVAKNYANDE